MIKNLFSDLWNKSEYRNKELPENEDEYANFGKGSERIWY